MSVESVIFLDHGTLSVPLRKPEFPHEWREFRATSIDEALERLTGATMAVTNKVHLRADLLQGLPGLKYIGLTATGFDNVDTGWCGAHGIAVTNVPGYADPSVPEHVFMLMLALRRNLPSYMQTVAAGEWQKSPLPNLAAFPLEDLAGSTLGLIGYGQLARAVESRAKAFGMTVVIGERKGVTAVRPGRLAFDRVLAEADVISLHVPLVPETRGLIGAAEIARMKKTAILINAARGGVVDEAALAEALRAGRIGGAGTDVLSQEPPKNGNPLLDLRLPNLIITPHVAWASRQAQERLAEEVILNIEAFQRGERRNRIV